MTWFKSRYVASLEAEVERLRLENRGLLNTVLVNTGHKPIERSGEPMQPIKRRSKLSWPQWAAKMQANARKFAEEVSKDGDISKTQTPN